MKALCLLLCVLAGVAQARPVVIEESALINRPNSSWQYFGRFGVAIDDDWALVSGERYVNDADTGLQRHEGAAFLYHRQGGLWAYWTQLGPVAEITNRIKPGLGMRGGIAVTIIDSARVFQQVDGTWTWVSYIDSDLDGPDVEVDDAHVLLPMRACEYNDVVAHNGVPEPYINWTEEGRLEGGNYHGCYIGAPTADGDLQGNRAVILSPQNDPAETPVVRLYRRNGNWGLFATIANNQVGNIMGPAVALSGPYVAFTGRRERGTSVAYYPDDQGGVWANTGLQAVDSYLEPTEASTTTLERAGSNIFAQRNYSFDRGQYVINLFRMVPDYGHTALHIATLQSRNGTSAGTRIDSDGHSVVVSGLTDLGNGEVEGDNRVHVYDLPSSYETPAVQVHDFSSSSSGAAWQSSPGSQFKVTRVGSNGVYRQTGTGGEVYSWLPSSTSRDQSVQAEITVRRVVGADRWVGLITRHADSDNFYYVTLRTGGTVQLKRMHDGKFKTLASAPATVAVGGKYRLRLESIGTQHRVYLDDRQVLSATDGAIRGAGDAGVAAYRIEADYDNVIVTPSPLASIYVDDFSSGLLDLWFGKTGSGWQPTGGVLHQVYTGGYARAWTGTPTEDQVVRARIRPVKFVEPGTWVGLMARYWDDRNHVYVSLVGRGVVSLWRRTNGVIEQLATRPMSVTPGTWYDVRLETAAGRTRVFVNDQLMLSTTADLGPTTGYLQPGQGHVGLITYRAKADFDDFRAYQP